MSEPSLDKALAGFPDVKLQTKSEFQTDQSAWVDQILGIFYVLLGLAVMISLFGIVNTLALSVMERTRELGMLRAFGMTRRGVRRMIRHESIVTALVGATLGIAVGLLLAALATTALSEEGLRFALPLGSLVGSPWWPRWPARWPRSARPAVPRGSTWCDALGLRVGAWPSRRRPRLPSSGGRLACRWRYARGFAEFAAYMTVNSAHPSGALRDAPPVGLTARGPPGAPGPAAPACRRTARPRRPRPRPGTAYRS